MSPPLLGMDEPGTYHVMGERRAVPAPVVVDAEIPPTYQELRNRLNAADARASLAEQRVRELEARLAQGPTGDGA